MLIVKDQRHVFSEDGDMFIFKNTVSFVTQYLGCIAWLFMHFQILHTSLNIGSHCEVEVYAKEPKT